MSPRRISVVAILALGLVVPLAALAKLPSPKSKAIVLGKSIGSVKLGASLADAKRAWGPGAVCTTQPETTIPQTRCSWADAKNGTADLTVTADAVSAIALHPGFDKKKQLARLTGPITLYRTSKGIGIGSTVKALRKAYPKVTGGAANTLVIFAGRITTSFDVQRGRISVVAINAQP